MAVMASGSGSGSQDEISVAELWAILAKGKWWVIGCIVASLLAAFTYLTLTKPVYEATAKIRIGQVAGGGLFEAPEVIAARLLARYGEDLATGVKRESPWLKNASVPKGLASVVQIVSEGDTPWQAVDLLNQVYAHVRESHEPTYAQGVKTLDERLGYLESQRTVLVGQIGEAQALIESLKQKDPVQASLVLIESGRLATTVTNLDAERPAIVQQRLAPQTQATALLGEIETPAKPARPKRALVVTLALVVGLMVGVIAAFLVSIGAVRGNPAGEI